MKKFNRDDIPVLRGRDAGIEPPPFRGFVEDSLDRLLPGSGNSAKSIPDGGEYGGGSAEFRVLVLGPFTELARRIESDRSIVKRISEVVAPGSPRADANWNIARDPLAFEKVRNAGLHVTFVGGDPCYSSKPADWLGPNGSDTQADTSIGETVISGLRRDPAAWRHYANERVEFFDELGAVYVAEPEMFAKVENADVGEKTLVGPVGELFLRLLDDGRQRKEAVLLVAPDLPPDALREDLRVRRESILQKNGRVEWFAQLQMNELHEHLGAYSIIGVKMGLRAAELLNAPPHGMKVVSHISGEPPQSCMNDGIIVSTGSTPGRTLFTIASRDGVGASVTFTRGGRSVTLRLKAEWETRIRSKIREILDEHSLEDPEYWIEVRRVGLEIWENWHRSDLFEEVTP